MTPISIDNVLRSVDPSTKLVLLAFSIWLVSLLLTAIRRTFFSELSRFPGPKLAAVSNWYEFYYDVWQQGQFTFKIQELHKRYGPIIRITPTELHIADANFYEQLYSRAHGPQDKYEYFANRFGKNETDTFSTWQHDLHRSRRKALEPMFSKKRVSDFESVIRTKVEKVCRRLVEACDCGKTVPLDRAWIALTSDVISEYAFARSFDNLDLANFEDEPFKPCLETTYTTGNFTLHFPVVMSLLDRLPDALVTRLKPELAPFIKFRRDGERQVADIRSGINEGHKYAGHPTIFHELINSDLPPHEKSDKRLGDEAKLVIAAGLITTSWALTVASFHIINDAEVFRRLREELKAAMPDSSAAPLEWVKLERLPYLNGCVREAIRLSYGIATRNPRLSPEKEIQYGAWTIPKNTPVSMTTVDVCHDEALFPDSKRFVPNRWIANPKLERSFVGFGKGSRACLGMNLAQAELQISLAAIFQRFTFTLFETGIEDVEMRHAYMVPYPKWGSKGVRVRVRSVDL